MNPRRSAFLPSVILGAVLLALPSACAQVEHAVRGPVEAVVAVPSALPGHEEQYIVPASANRNSEAGVRALRNQEWDVAATAFQQALRDDPEDDASQYALGIAYEMSGKLADALTHYEAANSIPRKQKLQYITAIERVKQKLAR